MPGQPQHRTVEIERLRAGDGQRLRSIRLRALADSPAAFGTTFDEASAEPPENWELQINRMVTFVAVREFADLGLARGARHDSRPDTGYLLSMWVAPEARREGIAGRLIAAVVDWARSEKLQRLVLDVAENNLPALGLYRRHKFVPNGTRGTLPAPREHIREIQLERCLESASSTLYPVPCFQPPNHPACQSPNS